MNLYDTFYDDRYETQVNCFYGIVFYKGGEGETDYTLHTGGSNCGFRPGDALPISTLYYEYPNDFVIILNPLVDKFDAVLVENGRFVGFLQDVIDAPETIKGFYTREGSRLKVINAYQAKEYIHTYIDEFNKDESDRNAIDFAKTWVEPRSLEEELGELIEAFTWAQLNKEVEEIKVRVLEDYSAILQLLKEFGEKHPRVFKDYLRKHNLSFS